MTPVAERLSDERVAEVRRLASVEENDCLRDGARSAAQYHADVGSALTELQHRRAAEVGISNYPEIPEGWVLVPLASTDEMHSAYIKAKYEGPKPTLIPTLWAAMLAAAPKPPSPPATGVRVKARDAAMDEAISDVADITARAKAMNLGLAKYFVPDIERLLSAIGEQS